MLTDTSARTSICCKRCHVGINWKALAEYSQINTPHVAGFQSFSSFLHCFVLEKLAIASIKVDHLRPEK